MIRAGRERSGIDRRGAVAWRCGQGAGLGSRFARRSSRTHGRKDLGGLREAGQVRLVACPSCVPCTRRPPTPSRGRRRRRKGSEQAAVETGASRGEGSGAAVRPRSCPRIRAFGQAVRRRRGRRMNPAMPASASTPGVGSTSVTPCSLTVPDHDRSMPPLGGGVMPLPSMKP